MKIYSYVVDHDNGEAPNPYFDFCTLCRCKYRSQLTGRRNVVELAGEGDWVIGTGGASKRSAGHGKLVYAMRVDEKIERGKYFSDSRFAKKKQVKNGTYEQSRGDNQYPINDFERNEQFALISEHFYYFGAKAIVIPKKFKLEKNPRGFHYIHPEDFSPFLDWLKEKYKIGKQGDPCYQEPPKGAKQCKSFC